MHILTKMLVSKDTPRGGSRKSGKGGRQLLGRDLCIEKTKKNYITIKQRI